MEIKLAVRRLRYTFGDPGIITFIIQYIKISAALLYLIGGIAGLYLYYNFAYGRNYGQFCFTCFYGVFLSVLFGPVLKLLCAVVELFLGVRGDRIADSVDENFYADQSAQLTLRRLDNGTYISDVVGTLFLFIGYVITFDLFFDKSTHLYTNYSTITFDDVTYRPKPLRALFVIGSLGYVLSGTLLQLKIDRQSEGRVPEDEQDDSYGSGMNNNFNTNNDSKTGQSNNDIMSYFPSVSQISNWSPNLSYLLGGVLQYFLC